MMSPNVMSVGSMERFDDHHCVWRVGMNLEIWIHCPNPDRPYCKACGAQGKRSDFCRDCTPLATGKEAGAAQPLATNRLSTPGKKSTRRTVGKPRQPVPQLSMEEIMARFEKAKKR